MKRILLVEDDADHATLIRVRLQRSGFRGEIDWVTDGEQAMDYLIRRSPEDGVAEPALVLLDLNLPRMNGHETLQAIRADPQWKQLPVVVLTTSENERDRAYAASTGADDYLVKPLDDQAVARLLDRANEGPAAT